MQRDKGNLGLLLGLAIAVLLNMYFVFAAIQGDYGVFRMVEARMEVDVLKEDFAGITEEIARTRNLTRRLSNDYLDLELLDQQARSILGVMRADEIILKD